MVSSCLILGSAFLAGIGTIVFAVPIVPKSIVGTGMPEGGTYLCGFFIVASSDFVEFLQQSGFSQEAEAWRPDPANPVSQSERGSMMIFHEDPQLLKAGLVHNHQDKTTAAFQNILKVGSMYKLIKMYIEQNGPSGTSPKKLERIRGGFKRGEDLDVLTCIANAPNSE
ncbi:hypothetical protein F5879DRAFT_927399 [Lentinula edodes]|nr:hypothetical protein F5879DRAFT_927399 [Lentinula edodes]